MICFLDHDVRGSVYKQVGCLTDLVYTVYAHKVTDSGYGNVSVKYQNTMVTSQSCGRNCKRQIGSSDL